MQRDELIGIVADLAGPTGPMRTFADQLAERDRRVAEAPFEDAGGLVELLGQAAPGGIVREPPWAAALVDTLIVWGRREPDAMLRLIAPRVADPAARASAIGVIGGLRDERGLDVLEPCADATSGWDAPSRIALVAALGEIGGPRALSILERIGRGRHSGAFNRALAIARAAAHAEGPARTLPYGTLAELYEAAFSP
jgi:hypothetical protein